MPFNYVKQKLTIKKSRKNYSVQSELVVLEMSFEFFQELIMKLFIVTKKMSARLSTETFYTDF